MTADAYGIVAEIINKLEDGGLRKMVADHFATEFNKRSRSFEPSVWERMTGGPAGARFGEQQLSHLKGCLPAAKWSLTEAHVPNMSVTLTHHEQSRQAWVGRSPIRHNVVASTPQGRRINQLVSVGMDSTPASVEALLAATEVRHSLRECGGSYLR